MPAPGHHVHPASMSARSSLPAARARSTACSQRDAAGQLPADHAGEDDVGGVPEDLRPDHRQRHAGQREHDDARPQARAAAAGAAAASPTAGSSSTSRPACPCAIARWTAARAARPPAGYGQPRRRWPAACCAAAHAAALHGSWDSTISAYVGQVSSSSSCVRCPTIRAVLQHDDLVGVDDGGHPLRDDDHRGVGGHRPQRGPQPGVGGQVERGERVVEQVDLRPADQRPGDRQPLPLTAGDVGAALGDRRVQPARHLLDEVTRLGDLQARPTAPRRWRPGCRSAGCSPPFRRTGTASAAPARSAASSWSGVHVADVHPVHRARCRR